MNDPKFDTLKNYKQQCLEEFLLLDDDEAIGKFNSHVGLRYFNLALQKYFNVIHLEFERRHLDYSTIGSEKSLSFANEVKLAGKKLVIK